MRGYAALITILTSAFFSVHAQPVYKCGNTYSQTPCAPDAKAVDIKASNGCEIAENRYRSDCFDRRLADSDKASAKLSKEIALSKLRVQKVIDENGPITPPSEATLARNYAACQAAIRTKLKDPDSAKFDAFTRSANAAPALDYPTWHAAIAYSGLVNAKNSYGGYTGSKFAWCAFDLAEQRILFTRGPD